MNSSAVSKRVYGVALCAIFIALLAMPDERPRKSGTDSTAPRPQPATPAPRSPTTDTVNDPHPRLLPPGSTMPLPIATVNDDVLTRRLPGYGAGSPFHDGADMFCDIVAKALEHERKKGARHVQSILVRGQADGLINRGLTGYSRNQFPRRCQDTFSTPMDDLQLAALRACVVRDKLLVRLGPQASAAALWKDDLRDEPDGGASGGAWRSVTVEIAFAR